MTQRAERLKIERPTGPVRTARGPLVWKDTMNTRTFIRVLSITVMLSIASSTGAGAPALELDEIIERMNATAESIRDVEATAKVTRFDSVFEDTYPSKRKLYFARPHLTRVDTFEKRKGREVLTGQFILGEDFVLLVWPETRHGELRRLSAEQIKEMCDNSNDPISFFGRNLSEIRKDFQIEQISPPEDTRDKRVAIRIKPARADVRFDYEKVEMVIDTKTWLPRSIKAFEGGDKNVEGDEGDWILYEFTRIKLNRGLKPGTFQPPKGIKIEEVKEVKKSTDKK